MSSGCNSGVIGFVSLWWLFATKSSRRVRVFFPCCCPFRGGVGCERIGDRNMQTMRAAQVPRPNGAFEIVEREIAEPGDGSVRIKVQACGVCHSDSLTKEGNLSGAQYPRVPGHEVVGVVDGVGAGVSNWTRGQRVGVGWHGGNCGYCVACRRGQFFACQTFTSITGVTYDGGYAEYMIARAEAVAMCPGRVVARGWGAAHVRRCNYVQCSSQQRCANR